MVNDGSITRVGVIMAGGAGERFWPLSRRNRPKQLLALASPHATLLQETVDRLRPIIQSENLYIVTGEHLVERIRKESTGLPDGNILGEPCKRNTLGCLAYSAAHLLAVHGGDGAQLSMAIVAADHFIGDRSRFEAAVDAALHYAESHGSLVTHGIVPSRAETGYGYLKVDETAESLIGGGIPIYPVASFHEKPNLERAQEFVAAGNYYWNSGMFFWRLDRFLAELEIARPDVGRAIHDMATALKEGNHRGAAGIFEGLEDLSIDYALMEKARNVVVVRADYPWDRTMRHDAQGNVAEGEPVLVECKNCIVYNDLGSARMAVSVVGAENLIVVVTRDAVLVAPKGRVESARESVRQLRERGSTQI